MFALLGAAGNGATIAQLGYLMEVSPDERRPAYSGYFNTLVAPTTVLPILGAALEDGHPLVCAGKLASGHQARSAGADDDDPSTSDTLITTSYSG